MNLLEESMHDLIGFLSQASPEEFILPFIPIVAIILVFSIPLVAIITEYFQKKNRARLMEKAIENGVPVENLKIEDTPRRRLPYRSGMITTAVGIGIIVFGLLMAWGIAKTGDPEAEVGGAVMAGMGIIVLLIGAALLVNDKMNYKRFLSNGDGNGK